MNDDTEHAMRMTIFNQRDAAYKRCDELTLELSTARAQLITYSEFFDKHALGPKAAPSCMCCGQSMQGREPAIQHMELPGIVICLECRDARAQLAERDETCEKWRVECHDLLIANGLLSDELITNRSELARLRADAERRLAIMQELLISLDEVGATGSSIEALRREIKESMNNNSQSKEQESSNTKLGGESVGLDHRVTSPIQSESKT